MRYRILLAFLGFLIFSSCEESMLLKSEKKMKEDIQGTWRRDFQGRDVLMIHCPAKFDTSSVSEFWTFKDNMLYTTFEYEPTLGCDRGTIDSVINDIDTLIVSQFKIDTRIFDAFLKLQLISGAGDSAITYIDKWEFITLDDGVLYLATDDPKGGVLQMEFSKVK